MAGMWRVVGVLLWKNWRMKQRGSRFNRGRGSKRWLYPAFVTDMIIPLGLLLLFIQKLCQYNAQLVVPTANLSDILGLDFLDDDTDNDVRTSDRALMTSADGNMANIAAEGVAQLTSKSATLLMTVLPLLLAKSNQNLAILKRKESELFLQYLDRQYPAVSELGIPSYLEKTTIIPFDETISNEKADEILLKYPEKSGVHVYAGLDLRRRPESDGDAISYPFELLALFYQKQMTDPSDLEAMSQIAQFFSKDLTMNGTMHFPGLLPFQMSFNTFLRENATGFGRPTGSINDHLNDMTAVRPKMMCQVVNVMLEMGGLQWSVFPANSPLGHSVAACRRAVSKGKFSTKVQRFLLNLASLVGSRDQVDSLTASPLPSRPVKVMSGPLEGNIIFYFTCIFLWPYSQLVIAVVREKEQQLKEYLMIMGLPAMALLSSWFLLYFLASAVVVLLGTWLLSGSMFAATATGSACFCLLLMTFTASILLFGIAITPIFNQTKTAAACAPLVYFVLGVGAFLRSLVSVDAVASSPFLASLLAVLDGISSPMVFMASLRDVLAFDAVTSEHRAVTWTTVGTPCRVMASQCAGYLLLGWYLENVFPRTYGVQQKWYFVFQLSYWFPKTFAPHALAQDDSAPDEAVRSTEMNIDSIDERMDDTLREQSLTECLQHSQPSLFVHSLSKTYPNGKVALQNVSFGVRKGEIFGLLGPNGAGKSTTLSILSGIIPPTSGDAYVGGSISVANNPQAVRQSLSVCFQQNVLFDDLTVWEHLSLVCALKNSMGITTVSEETWRGKLEQFGLAEKCEALSNHLSGGQKRKLSLVMALLDSSRVLLLDEPTAGMDLKARLETWDSLKRAMTHRAVILTTHSMQEAQALCENIGIVANGKLKCCGSSLFLQNRFGVGYKLTVVRGEDVDQAKSLRPRHEAWTERLLKTLRKYVPNATIVSGNKWETRVQLKDGEERRFAELFRELETMKQAGTIKRYAIAATDLEDVFVKVTEGEDVYNHVKDDVEDEDVCKSGDPALSKLKSKMQGPDSGVDMDLPAWQVALSQLRALMIKRGKMSFRDKKSLFAQYVWPISFFAIAMIVAKQVFTSSGAIETVTALSPSVKETSLLISSASTVTDSVAAIVAEIASGANPMVFDRNVQTEEAMLDAIARDHDTAYFASVFVSEVNWTTSDSSLDSPAITYSLYYNESVSHSLPVTLQWMSQAYCKARAKRANVSGLETCDLSVKTGLFPIKIEMSTGVSTNEDGVELDPDETLNVVRQVSVAFYMIMTMSSVVGSYAAPVVREKECGLKRMQYRHLHATNASLLYWLANFLFDYTMYMMAVSLMFVILSVLAISVNKAVLAAWFVSLTLFGLAILPTQYLLSLVFSSHSSAQSYISYASTFQTMAASLMFATSIIPGLCVKANFIAYFLQFLPSYTFGVAVLDIVTVAWTPLRQQCLLAGNDLESGNPLAMFQMLGEGPQSSVWDWDVAGSSWFALVACAMMYTFLLISIDQYQMYPTEVEYKMRQALRRLRWYFRWPRHGRGYTEANQADGAIDEENPDADMVRAIRVSKVYDPLKKTKAEKANEAAESEGNAALTNEGGQVVALNDVSFRVEKRDCVALLGVNGSGKSTMFEILTAGTSPTNGKAMIDSCNVTTEPRQASMRYGYCPQGNKYYKDLSVRDHLELFYRLRCSSRNALLSEGAVIDELMKRLDLFPVEHTAASHLSGGNKRRLMLALALMSDQTSLLLLDEPSAGVDVVARRLMWRVLYEKRQSSKQTSCLFTTHSMEEAEAVCANAVVLFKSKVAWCGSIPDLKQRVSRGISINVQLDRAAIWTPQQVQLYTREIRHFLESVPATSSRRAGLERNGLPLQELDEAWELCHDLVHKNGDASASIVSQEHGKLWLAGLRARFDSDTVTAASTIGPDTTPLTLVPIVEFVHEWLVQEAFVRLETQLFKDEFTTRSGEVVISVDHENARGSGSHTGGMYETSCTADFGLADVFGLMEENKQRFNIAQYSISELSLERVFEQFS